MHESVFRRLKGWVFTQKPARFSYKRFRSMLGAERACMPFDGGHQFRKRLSVYLDYN